MAHPAIEDEPHFKPALQDASNYLVCARAHALDLASSLLLFFCASIAAGRVWRFPFDDEVYTLKQTEMRSVFEVFPRDSEMFFYGLRHLG